LAEKFLLYQQIAIDPLEEEHSETQEVAPQKREPPLKPLTVATSLSTIFSKNRQQQQQQLPSEPARKTKSSPNIPPIEQLPPPLPITSLEPPPAPSLTAAPDAATSPLDSPVKPAVGQPITVKPTPIVFSEILSSDFKVCTQEVLWLWKELLDLPQHPMPLVWVGNSNTSTPLQTSTPSNNTHKVPLGCTPYPEEMIQVLEDAHNSELNTDKTLTFIDAEGSWTLDINKKIQTCPGQKDRELVRHVSTAVMYIRDRVMTVEDPRLTVFKAVTKSINPISDIASFHLIKNFVSLLNTIKDGEIGKIYFGIDEGSGKILGICISKRQRDLLQNTIWEEIKDLDPRLTGQEFDICMVPVCSNQGSPIKDLFVIEVHVKLALYPLYFTRDGQCWARNGEELVKCVGSEIMNLLNKRREQRTLPPDHLRVEERPLQELPTEEWNSLNETYQQPLKVIRKVILKKRQAILETRNTEIEVLKGRLQSLEKLYKEKFELLRQAFDPNTMFNTYSEEEKNKNQMSSSHL
jgi:hypothetical protein